MPTKFDTRQSINHSILARLSGVADTELDDLLTSINTEVTPPLALSAVGTNRVVNIANILANNAATGITRTIPPISNTLPTFASGTVTLSASSPCTATPSAGTPVVFSVSSGNYIKLGINIDATGSLVLQAGTQGASIAAATVPPTISNTFAIGYIIVHNTGGTIDNILNSAIVQYAGGGGGSGSGTGNPILETFKNTILDSNYNLITPNIFSVNGSTLVDGSSTGAYSLVTGAFAFSSASQTYVSTQMLDPNEFLGQNKDVNQVMLQTVWTAGAIDTAATYAVSRDGGTNWKTVTMSRVGTTDTFSGEYTWTAEDTAVSLATAGGTGATLALNQTTQSSIAGIFALTSSTLNGAGFQGKFKLSKTGSPTGNIYASIVKLSGGQPSTSPSDVLAISGPLDATTLTGTPTVYTFTFGPAILNVSTNYALVLRVDYGTYSAGVNEVLVTKATSGTAIKLYNGTTGVWSDGAAGTPEISVFGRPLDLRARVTSSAGSVSLSGVGVYYDPSYSYPATGVKLVDSKQFLSTDNLSSFTIGFLPDPDLLTVYYVQAGQAFRFGAFSLDGYTVRFPANSFNNGGVASTVTLIFDQTQGGGFDNSNQNASLLSSNFLGSTDGTTDKSVSGRGIRLRNAAGVLREIALDASDNIIISTVP